MWQQSLVTVRMFIYIVVLDIPACLVHQSTPSAHPLKGCKWVFLVMYVSISHYVKSVTVRNVTIRICSQQQFDSHIST